MSFLLLENMFLLNTSCFRNSNMDPNFLWGEIKALNEPDKSKDRESVRLHHVDVEGPRLHQPSSRHQPPTNEYVILKTVCLLMKIKSLSKLSYFHNYAPFEKGGAYCVAHVGLSVSPSVGMSVSLNLVQLKTQEGFAPEASNLVGR